LRYIINYVTTHTVQVLEVMKKYGISRSKEGGDEMEKGEREVAEMQFPAIERMLAVCGGITFLDDVFCVVTITLGLVRMWSLTGH